MKSTFAAKPGVTWPRYMSRLRATQFDFSKQRRSANPERLTADASYLDWLARSVPRGWDTDAPHLRAIAAHLDRVTRGDIDRLAIFMPPRHGKSETVTVRYPVYRLEREPGASILVTGYNQRIANRFGLKVKRAATGSVAMAAEKSASDEWHTADGGQVLARGVGSPPTGVGFGLVVIDDPIRRREDADSQTYRDKAWDWYTDDLYTRLEPGGAIIMVLTRWHEDDVASRAIASEPGRWTILRLPALAEPGDPMGRAEGEALWPARWPVEALHRTRDVMAANEGLRSWEALYQQNPQPRDGQMFKPAMLTLLDERPECARRVRRWDLASSDGQGDYTVGALLGMMPDGRVCILHVERGQWATDERDAVIRRVADADGRQVRVVVPQDPGSAGLDVAKHLTRLLSGYSVRAVRETGDKTLRADPFASQVNAGNVCMVRAGWNASLVAEMRAFPSGAHDDQIDAVGGAFAALTAAQGVEYAPSIYA